MAPIARVTGKEVKASNPNAAALVRNDTNTTRRVRGRVALLRDRGGRVALVATSRWKINAQRGQSGGRHRQHTDEEPSAEERRQQHR